MATHTCARHLPVHTSHLAPALTNQRVQRREVSRVGAAVMKHEAQALIAAADLLERASSDLNAAFEAAATLLLKRTGSERRIGTSLDNSGTRVIGHTGRAILSGMGKSGHVARKIAATLASTGTPAQFVHPGEASHGDLGMIGRKDVVIALSNSGKTQELAAIINYTREAGIPLIAITSNPNSPLAENSDVRLILPHHKEACPLGTAPTTSTTLMMALGDALAGGVVMLRGFSKGDFGIYHPGGTLGANLGRVSDIMHTGPKIPLVNGDDGIQAVLMVIAKDFGCAGVIDGNGKLVGIITDRELQNHLTDKNFMQLTAQEMMRRSPPTTSPSTMVAQAVLAGKQDGTSRLFVVDEQQRPTGFLHLPGIGQSTAG